MRVGTPDEHQSDQSHRSSHGEARKTDLVGKKVFLGARDPGFATVPELVFGRLDRTEKVHAVSACAAVLVCGSIR